MKKIVLSKDEVVTVDDDIYDAVNGSFSLRVVYAKNGRLRYVAAGRTPLHWLVMGQKNFRGREIDHIDRNPLNNLKSNLRFVSKTENCWNRANYKHRKFKGVQFCKDIAMWFAIIESNKKKYHLGFSTSELLSAIRYNIASRFLHKGFGFQNPVINKSEIVYCRRHNFGDTKGVSSASGKDGFFRAFLTANKKQVHIGNNFKNKEDASAAYDKAAYEWNGINASLNNPCQFPTKINITEENIFYFEKYIYSQFSIKIKKSIPYIHF